ncbi:MAG: ABC transporter permease subunit [Planctomycetota bacterium]
MSERTEPTHSPRPRQRTPLSARGEPMVWLTGGALVACLVMILGLVGMIVVNGLKTYWPRPIDRVTLESGEVFLGVPMETDEESARTLYRTGNRDLGREPFRWVDQSEVVSVERPPEAVLVEREVWSVWLGQPERAIEIDDSGEQRPVAQGAEETLAFIRANHSAARARRAEIERLKRDDLGEINRRIEAQRLMVRGAELALARPGQAVSSLGWVASVGIIAGVFLASTGAVVVGRRSAAGAGGGRPGGARVGRFVLASLAVTGVLALWIHGPWRGAGMTEARLETLRAEAAATEAGLAEAYDVLLAEIRALEAEDARQRIVIVEPTEGRFAPVRQIEPDEPLLLSQIVRVVDANRMGPGARLETYFSRWWEFLSAPPREANTEGGVFPVIMGTVMLTLLLTVTVTPLGVIAALYLREYAKQGVITSIIRIAVNNLAGVPSIVYGVFGLGFFCYTVGRYIDSGPAPTFRLPPAWWWGCVGLGLVSMVFAYACAVWSKPIPGTEATRAQVLLRRVAVGLWAATFVLAVVLVVRTPFFTGFFEARAADGSPTFGSRGMLWASLTLALLTLPVVIVSTEEAIAAVPNSMREGSYGCGASKWQTLWRIVLPGALPGILTGAILAMARGAGEVAPLMLVGAVKLNQDLPMSGEAPFLHLDRSFMHLGFHIYDLGFQSPDSQAARPLVWTTTLLLLAIVLSLNLVAVVIRAKLRARLSGPTV